MKRSIFFKIFTGYCLITIMMVAGILLFSFRSIQMHMTETLKQDLLRLASTLRAQAAIHITQGRIDELNHIVTELGEEIGVRITIVDPSGSILADSERDPDSMEKHRARPEVAEALRGRIGTSVRYSTTVKEEMQYVAVPVKEGDRILGVVRVGLYLRDTARLTNRLRKDLALIAMLVISFSLLVSAGFSRGITKPIHELNEASKDIALGNMRRRVFLKSRDELRELANSFNEMSSKTESIFEELSRQTEELDGIIRSLHDGLVVVDREGKIVLCNEGFQRIVCRTEIVGRHYWEILRDPTFGKWVDRVKQTQAELVEEMDYEGRIYLCSLTYLGMRGGVSVILHDITKRKELERMKKDFLVNVSHEMRTPLTAIKGFAETLAGISEEDKKYVEIIQRHTNKLIDIVNDLLMLSELEEPQIVLQLENVKIAELIDNVVKLFQSGADAKGIQVQVNADECLKIVSGDLFRLEQMLINLVDNAVKYTDKGKITISLEQKSTEAVIKIQDTGIGIPREHLARIFERFYVVDRSRSRRRGGTGLGLSIVKHIVLLHHGRIEIDSHPGEGTTVTVALPTKIG